MSESPVVLGKGVLVPAGVMASVIALTWIASTHANEVASQIGITNSRIENLTKVTNNRFQALTSSVTRIESQLLSVASNERKNGTEQAKLQEQVRMLEQRIKVLESRRGK